jgi:hypothetical protein
MYEHNGQKQRRGGAKACWSAGALEIPTLRRLITPFREPLPRGADKFLLFAFSFVPFYGKPGANLQHHQELWHPH